MPKRGRVKSIHTNKYAGKGAIGSKRSKYAQKQNIPWEKRMERDRIQREMQRTGRPIEEIREELEKTAKHKVILRKAAQEIDDITRAAEERIKGFEKLLRRASYKRDVERYQREIMNERAMLRMEIGKIRKKYGLPEE